MSHEKNKELLQSLADCAAECNHCAAHCLEENQINVLSRCIMLDMDCAEICQLVIGYISRGSEHASQLLEVCEEICIACAAECDKHAHMDHCTRCAVVCRHCAELCHKGIAA